MRRLALTLLLLASAASAAADGGRMRLRRDAGPFAITVFTAPEPLTAGIADVSVLVQDRRSLEVVLDAGVEIAVRPRGADAPRVFAASLAKNRLLRAASVELDSPGDWELSVTVSRGGDREEVACAMRVEPVSPPLERIWIFLAAPPLAIALFAAHRGLLRRSRVRL